MDERLQKLIEANESAIDNDLEVMKDVVEKSNDARREIFSLLGRISTATGIIAGFGFTAMDKVVTIPSFLLGQGILFASIVVSLYWLKYAHTKEYNVYKDYISKISEVLTLRRAFDKLLRVSPVDPQEIDKASQAIIGKIDKIFLERAQLTDRIFSVLAVLISFGALLMLTSFTNFWPLFNDFVLKVDTQNPPYFMKYFLFSSIMLELIGALLVAKGGMAFFSKSEVARSSMLTIPKSSTEGPPSEDDLVNSPQGREKMRARKSVRIGTVFILFGLFIEALIILLQ